MLARKAQDGIAPSNFWSIKKVLCSVFLLNCVCVCFFSDAAAQEYPETVEDEDEETPNYEEKAQEIVQSILQEVVNTVAGGEMCSLCS